MIPRTRDEALSALEALSRAPAERFDLTACALACAVHEAPDRDFAPATAALDAVARAACVRSPASAADFAALMFAELGFSGDRHTYDDPANADLPAILHRKRGLPVGLAVVWRHAARAVEAPLHGVGAPGHFIMRLETGAGPQFVDPFEGGAVLDEADLADLAKSNGLEALHPDMLLPISDRMVAVRLQTNLATRARAAGDAAGWERAARRRALIAPADGRCALDHAEAAVAAGLLRDARSAALAAQSLGTAGVAQAAERLLATLVKTLN